jgi:hypothetical protein
VTEITINKGAFDVRGSRAGAGIGAGGAADGGVPHVEDLIVRGDSFITIVRRMDGSAVPVAITCLSETDDCFDGP